MTDLYRLVYTSKNLLHGSKSDIADAVAGILAASQRNNARVGVTGALMFNAGAFAQVLEGPQRAVETTFERIQRDPRHGDVTVLQCCAIDAPSFPSWSMAFVGQSAAGQALWQGMAAASGFDLSRLEGDAVFAMLRSLVLEEEGVRAGADDPSSHQADSDAANGPFDVDRAHAARPRPGQTLAARRVPGETSPPATPEALDHGHAAQAMQSGVEAADKTMIALAIFRAALADERLRTTELRTELDEARVLLAVSEARVAAVSGERDLWAGRARLLATALCSDAPAAWSDRATGSGGPATGPSLARLDIRSVA